MGKLLLGILLAVFAGSLFALPNYYTTVTAWYVTANNVTFQLNTTNNGTAANVSSTSNYSTNTGMSGTYSVPALAAGGRYSYYVSAPCTAGQTVWMYGGADVTNAIAEYNEWDNFGMGYGTCAGQQQPDLTSRADGAGGNKVVGVPFTVNVTTSNIGSASSGVTSVTRVRFSWDIVNLNVPILAAGGTNTQPATFTCPYAGVFTLNTTADATYVVGESNEVNNFVSYQVNCVAAAQPDLIVLLNATNSSGNLYAVGVTVRNIGQATAGPSTTRTSYNGVVQNMNFPSIPPAGSQLTLYRYVECRASPTPFYATADINNAVLESNELNNNATVIVPACAGQQPDLTISTLTAPTTVIVGRSFTYTVETYNNGPGSSSPSVTFAAFQTSGSNILIPGLPAGMGQVNTVTSVCSSAGRFQLTATADSTHTNTETNEANNARSVYVRCFGRIEGNATNATESSISPGPLPSDRSAAVLGALGIGIDIRKLLGSLGIVFGK